MSNPLLPDESKTKAATAESNRVDSGKLTDSVYLKAGVKNWWVHELWSPLELYFIRKGIKPDTITWIGVALTAVACLLLASNSLIIGGWFLCFAASFDFLDGRVARLTGKTSQSGAFLDSVLDRYMDGMMFFSMAWLFKDSWVSIFCLFAFFGSATTSYVRAKAEAIGLKASGGEMQRAERILYVGAGAVFSGYWECLNYPFRSPGWSSPPYVLIAAILFIAFVSNKVAFGRIHHCLRQLKNSSQ